ncbi:MAG: hypothetical protein HS132_03025 [Planctomycetia bacterium]|nr:hypothetical protein [Planctomycetia bacterium]
MEDTFKILFIGYYLTNTALITLLFISLSKKWSSLASLPRKIIMYSQAAIGIVNIPVVIYAYIENIAPRLMQLPYHHCIYCFMGNGLVLMPPLCLGYLSLVPLLSVGWVCCVFFAWFQKHTL